MGAGCILLVEDNPNDVKLTERAFKKGNFPNELIIARDGVEALEFLYGSGPDTAQGVGDMPTLILLDLKLPRIDGLELLRRIRADERTALVPVVILTSSEDEKDVNNGYRLGANSYIRKPINFDQFIEVVRHMGMYWLTLNKLPSGRRIR